MIRWANSSPYKPCIKHLFLIRGSTQRGQCIVVAADGPSLLGPDWLQQIQLDWSGLHALNAAGPNNQWQDIIDRHPNVFKDELGRVQGTTAKFYLKSGVKPKFLRALPVPYVLQEKVERELDRLYTNKWCYRTGAILWLGCTNRSCGEEGWISSHLRRL